MVSPGSGKGLVVSLEGRRRVLEDLQTQKIRALFCPQRLIGIWVSASRVSGSGRAAIGLGGFGCLLCSPGMLRI